MEPMASAQPVPEAPHVGIVLYDGVCVFCNDTVRWLIERDDGARLRFAPLQGETAGALRGRHPEIPRDIDTIVYVDVSDGSERVTLRFPALLRAWREVSPRARLPLLLGWIPRPLTELAYRVFVRLRYRLFGRLEQCRIPTPEERARFLD